MKIHAAMRENQPEIIEEAYEISEILELSESEYASLYQDLLEDQEYFAQRKSEDDAILILGENQNDGILVQTQNKGFAYKSSFIPEARLIAEHHIRQLADYCISEGTQYSENGNWSIPYEELYQRFDTKISDKNGNGRLLKKELQQRKEINELIMTEDCIEMTYHMEYCQQCQEGGLAGAMSLFSLMGCNLFDVHFECGTDDSDLPVVSELRKGTLTAEGKKDWSDVLNSTAESLRHGYNCLICKLSNCDLHRLQAFSKMLNGQCEAEDYERWVQMNRVQHVGADEISTDDFNDRYSADLVATYEELMNIPHEKRVTAYFGDYSLHYFKYGTAESQIRPAYENALKAMEMSEQEFQKQKKNFLYRGEMIGRMRDCLLSHELHNGERVLFVATEPYASADDFALRGGIILGINRDEKTCRIHGEFFTMEDIPLHYVLGRHDPNTHEKHYGFKNVQPLFGEYPALAQQYLSEVRSAYNEMAEAEEKPDDGFVQNCSV